MAAKYPGGVYSPRAKENKPGVIYDANKKTIGYVEDVIKLDEEVVAIETELGTDPKGAAADVKTRLDDVDTAISAKMTNPMTTAEDLVKGGAGGTPGRLAKGGEGKVLGIASGVLAWISAAATFLGLTDTPADYTGQAGKTVVVNGTEDGLEFAAAGGGGTWVIVADVTLESAASSIDSGTLVEYKFYKFILHIPNTSTNSKTTMRLNTLTTNIYGSHSLYDASNYTQTNSTSIYISAFQTNTTSYPQLYNGHISNFDGIRKMITWLGVNGDASAAIGRQYKGGGIINLTDLITSIQFLTSSGNFNTGTRLIILGLSL